MKSIYLILLTISELVFWILIWEAGDVGSTHGNKAAYSFFIVLTSLVILSVIGISIYNMIIGKNVVVPIISILLSILAAIFTWPFILSLVSMLKS